ncbi:hypothetical protein WA026_005302 [Henosepilachna vigintioctopunctata]|uniref:Uncharacterized protein n=1 Tax=Henosepilachna vigintioctopunctata TaxID=420089 RepID=A0AAW1ULK0_9CUCU
MMNEPTRITNHSATCIDILSTNILNGESTICQPHLSDHTAQSYKINLEIIKSTDSKQKKIGIYSEKAFEKFGSILRETNWEKIRCYKNYEINEMWECFSQYFQVDFEDYFPLTDAPENSLSKTPSGMIRQNI